MWRNHGLSEVALNFEPLKRQELDARESVDTFLDLINTDTWEDSNWSEWTYEDMRVFVKDEKVRYVLINTDYTNPSNWVVVWTGTTVVKQWDVEFMTFLTIAQAEAAMWVIDSEFCFVFETKMFYHCEVWSTEIPNNNDVLDLDWGAAKWIHSYDDIWPFVKNGTLIEPRVSNDDLDMGQWKIRWSILKLNTQDNTWYIQACEDLSIFKNQVPEMVANNAPNGIAYCDQSSDARYGFDRNIDTRIGIISATAPVELSYEFTTVRNITRYKVQSSAFEQYQPSWRDFQWRDGSSWITLDTQTGQIFASDDEKVYDFINTNSYIKYRLNATELENTGSATWRYQMAWLEFRGTAETFENSIPIMTWLTTPEGIAYSSEDSWDAWLLFDRDPSTRIFDGSCTLPVIMSYEFVENIIIQKYVIWAATSMNTRMPDTWNFQWFDWVSWVTLDTQTWQTFAAWEHKEYLITNATAYISYRVEVTALRTSNDLVMATIEMHGKKSVWPILFKLTDDFKLGIQNDTPDWVLDVTPDTIAWDSYMYWVRVTTTQMNALWGMTSWASVWNLTTNSPWYYDGTQWVEYWLYISPLSTTDSFVLTWTDITNWYVDLTNIVDQNKLTIFTIWGLTNYDYTITTNRLTFWPSLDLAVWDEIDVNYYY